MGVYDIEMGVRCLGIQRGGLIGVRGGVISVWELPWVSSRWGIGSIGYRV
jgi:hypothetical protein